MPFLSTDDASLYYTVQGHGPHLVVLHHGHCSSHATWTSCAGGFAEALLLQCGDGAGGCSSGSKGKQCAGGDVDAAAAASGITLLMLDARGTGASKDKGGDSRYTIQQLAEDVLAVVKRAPEIPCAARGSRFTFVGHSMGSLVGLHLALHHTAHVAKLVMVAPPPITGAALRQKLPPDVLQQVIDRRKKGQTDAAFSDKLLGEYTAMCPRPVAPQAVKRSHDLHLAATDQHHDLLWRQMMTVDFNLQALTTPTLVVAGAADTLLRFNVRDYSAIHRTASLHVFSRVGHSIPREVPQELADVVADFMVHGVVSAQSLWAKASKL